MRSRAAGRDVQFILVDNNRHVVEQSRRAAAELGYENMTFLCDDILCAQLTRRPDVVYSLHACDAATDMTIARGIAARANYIITVSCCQHHVRACMKRHPWTPITRYAVV